MKDIKASAPGVMKHGLCGASENQENESNLEFDKGESRYNTTRTLPCHESLGGGTFAEYKRRALNGMKHMWMNYKERSFGSDELKPISRGMSQNW